MTVEELIEKLRVRNPKTEIHVCHFAKRAGQAKPIIFPLAAVRWIKGQLCLVEEDDLTLYLASI
ncbi:hypothetical protein ES707_09607 [subsurface metagenome]